MPRRYTIKSGNLASLLQCLGTATREDALLHLRHTMDLMERLSENGTRVVNLSTLHEAMGYGTTRNNDILAALMRAGHLRWQGDWSSPGGNGYRFTPR
jgi:hypothetical protein